MKQLVFSGLLVVAAAVPAQAQVQVGVNIGIQLPSPPAFVVVPGTPVYYAPRAPANLFFYAESILGLRQQPVARRADLERPVGGRPAGVRSGSHSPSARPLLSRAAPALERLAPRGAAVVGTPLRTRLA